MDRLLGKPAEQEAVGDGIEEIEDVGLQDPRASMTNPLEKLVQSLVNA
jgi:hypothetical protein